VPPTGCGIPIASRAAANARRSSASELDQGAGDALDLGDLHGAVEVERLEVQAVRGVEVRGHRLRVGVDENRAHTGLMQRPRGMDRAVIELDPLTDPDRPGPNHKGGTSGDRLAFGLLFPA